MVRRRVERLVWRAMARLFVDDFELAVAVIVGMLLVVYVFACWLTRHTA